MVVPTGPARCWICHEEFQRRVPDWHYRDIHPEFYSWNKPFQKKLSLVSAIPLVLDPVLLSLLYLHVNVPTWAYDVFFVSLVPPIAGLLLWARVSHKYRQRWVLDHPKEPVHRHHYSPPRIAIEGALMAILGFVLTTIGLAYHTLPFSLSVFLSGWYVILIGGAFAFYGRLVGKHPFESRDFVFAFFGITITFAALASGTGLADIGVNCGINVVVNSDCAAVVSLAALVYVGLIITGTVLVAKIYRRSLKIRSKKEHNGI